MKAQICQDAMPIIFYEVPPAIVGAPMSRSSLEVACDGAAVSSSAERLSRAAMKPRRCRVARCSGAAVGFLGLTMFICSSIGRCKNEDRGKSECRGKVKCRDKAECRDKKEGLVLTSPSR